MIVCVLMVWLGAACISLPPLLILGNEHRFEQDGKEILVCIVCQDIFYQVYATLCSFYIPLTVMIVVYLKIFQAARRIVREERMAQMHLDPRAMEISCRNGDGPPQNRISSQTPSPAANHGRSVNHRHSTTSTNTTVR